MNKEFNNNSLETNYQKLLASRNNQQFVYRQEYFFPLLEETNKTLEKVKVKGKLDMHKYENLLKNFNN